LSPPRGLAGARSEGVADAVVGVGVVVGGFFLIFLPLLVSSSPHPTTFRAYWV